MIYRFTRQPELTYVEEQNTVYLVTTLSRFPSGSQKLVVRNYRENRR